MKIFLDSADLGAMTEALWVNGFTTNPTLMRAAGVTDYLEWAHHVVRAIPDRPVSFEVIADDLPGMERQALQLATLGSNVYVKIPITTTDGETTRSVIERLTGRAVKVNVTAVLTFGQVMECAEALGDGAPAIVSVFAGRIADTGRNPMPLITDTVGWLAQQPQIEVLWASTREVLNVEQARAAGAHIITVSPAIYAKRALFHRDLAQLSLETVRQFRADALAAGYAL